MYYTVQMLLTYSVSHTILILELHLCFKPFCTSHQIYVTAWQLF